MSIVNLIEELDLYFIWITLKLSNNLIQLLCIQGQQMDRAFIVDCFLMEGLRLKSKYFA